ncbi:type IX secretion system periplasmic lipoprotein PorW/SprE [Cellulophaga omnivescoria]|uniref:type IX secretion system periplasmic lipoprotein PorW/SprE n=1 Tax=Cellulophaga omnivescoria TaxID=1888890 RepID=UPI0022F1128D|nr:hypothetical protein [Cellulophaga omnivescoria]WBU90725.1 hypothetical protein PBN93_06835 [Cellulophaga omnivescoria]
MKLQTKIIGTVALAALVFNACSTKKNAFVNREWHALNTKFNVLYNGNIAFEKGREELNANYKDNYWDLLPIERLEVTDDVKLDSENNNPNFVIAEEKATKAIQKHSMVIKDRERNPQTDEAYLLLGKARYFDQRFIPAQEAFNYVLKNYIQSDKFNEARIWREKTNVRLENDELAIKNLKKLFKYDDLSDQEYADARAVMAQAYINLNAPDTAIQQLKRASVYTKKQEEKGRYYFIIGQLYNQLNKKDSANYAFDKIIDLNRKSPRVYFINAHLQKIMNTAVTASNKEEMLEYLTDLEENRENRPFLDKIYRQKAQFFLNQQQDSLALVYFDKSLRATTNDNKLNALNYENLGEYYFDKNNYKQAGAYFDSTLTNLVETSKKHRLIKKKLDNLEDVVKYEDIVQYTDSVVTIYNLPKEKQITYFQKFIEDKKAKEEAAAKKEKERQNAGIAAFANTKAGKQNKGKFYFYNITSLGYGKTDFKTAWGSRKLEDNWRWSNKNVVLQTNDDTAVAGNASNAIVEEGQEYKVDYYMDKLPTSVAVIDSLKKERNFANYQLGLIYKEKFKENLLAAGKLESVLKSNPEERLILPSKYNLYKIYEESGSNLAAAMKQDIIANHQGSRYAEVLLNPKAILEGSADTPNARYTRLYKMFQNQEYLKVITGAEENINRYTGDEIAPKFEILKAMATGRIEGFEAFKEALNYVALNYPNNPEGKRAQEMIKYQIPQLEKSDFVDQSTNAKGTWKVVFPFSRNNDAAANELYKLLNKSVEDLKYKNKVSKDIYNLEQQFVVVHGFASEEFALGYAELLKNNKDYKVGHQNFVILSNNYKVVQVHKKLNEYKKTLLIPKP